MQQIFNDENMYDVDSTWYGAFKPVVSDESPLGIQLSSDEFSNVLSAINDETQKVTLNKFLQRWNNTATAWKDGTLNTLTDVADVINFRKLDPGIQQYIDDHSNAKTKGFNSIFDVYDHAAETYKAAEQETQSGSSESICAKVRVRIVQDLVLTRDAFNTRLEIENGETSALENIKVEIRITQTFGNGESAKDTFSIGKPSLIGISGVDGEGTLEKDISGSAEWLMIPYSTAAPQDDTLYDVGGQLSYSVGGSNFSVPLLPDIITVKPNPRLVVHYFYEKYVRGDDPLTVAIEPIIPFNLAVTVMNDGFGTAQALRISSAQPEIIENEKGLLITFKILGAKLGNEQIAPSLSVNFGDIHSFETKTATWLLTSTLKGTFYNYTATFENINPLGDPQLSLFDELGYHELVHLVRINTENESDDFDDFLVNDIVDSETMPDRLYSTQNGSNVYDVYIGNLTQLYTSSYVRSQKKVYTVVHLKVTANTSTWTYTRIENNITSSNPVDSQNLLQCESSLNRKLMIEKNVWQTTHILDKFFLHIFDFIPSNETAEEGVEVTYDITFGPRNMYAPIFNMTSYSQTVPFDASIGSVILTLSGHDIDDNQMSFQIVDEDIKPVFAINETIGSINTKVLLNSTTVYTFKVMIVDHGIPPMSSMTNITISVTDYIISSVPSTDTASPVSTPLTSYITEYTIKSSESSAARETVGSETSTRSREMYTSESQATPTITTGYTTESSIPAGQTNHYYATSTVKVENKCNSTSLACDLLNGGCSINSTGDAFCFCNAGYEFTNPGVSYTCTVENKCNSTSLACDLLNGGCSINSTGDAFCFCNAGYEFTNPGVSYTCTVENKCNSTSLACDLLNGGCSINSTGDAFCFCNAGYEFTNPGVSYTCTVENKCNSTSLACDLLNGGCSINSTGDAFCFCNAGYEFTNPGVSYTCTVENKCNSTSLACDLLNGGCSINSTGDAFCFCNAGYEFTNPGVSYTCTVENKCNSTSLACDLLNGGCSINSTGDAFCFCNAGYEFTNPGVSYTCTVENKCNSTSLACDLLNGGCSINSTGDAFCFCNAGYEFTNPGVSYTCTVENKCNSTSLACDLLNGGCSINSTGDAFCFCNAGYEFTNPGVSYTCTDENECVLQTHSCNQRCINKAGGYLCSCKDGFVLTGNTTCQNIDECILLNNNCEQICVDTIGSFNCSCRDGFVLNSDQRSCNKDYDPCGNKNINCSYGCVLENSAPVCYCPENYELSIDDNQTCSVVYRSVEISMTTDYPYASEMADPSTDEFKHARVDIKVALYYRYSNIPGFLSLTVISFSFGSTIVQYTVVFNQSLSDSKIIEIASVTNNITHITVLEKPYGVTGETFVNYQKTNQEPLTCTLCKANHTCVILKTNTYECRPPLSKLESRSLFIEATLWKTFNQNYGNKLHLDYAAYEEEVEQAFATEMSGVEDIQYLNVTNLRNQQEGVITNLVMIFNTAANKTLQYDKVLNILIKIETEERSCTDLVDTCIAVNGSITLGNTTIALEPVICSTCSLTQHCIQDNETSRYQCVNQPTTDQTNSSTSERTTTTVQSKSSSDLILGLGIGLPLAITAFVIFSTIMICVFCRCKKRKSESIVQGQSEDDNWQIRQAFGRKDSSLRGTKSFVGFYNEVAY
ncbi:uncharacterized protein LOC127730155 isoform X4 [Mytilus californianus]|uniref:uncharacterized protein LOC127730155 isoform X4 n=1 Tax=Mytilus californianus TaxID=6549 RepID=UPI0022480102|nr:uncharacterized protein LOC127730155 isoform X4 [Mytilus californianus]